jgi:AcrR family transcriptional regulator
MVAKQHRKRAATSGGSGGKVNLGRTHDLLWESPARTGRGPKPELSVDAVVRAAIEVVDAQGLGALTMARVATQLDVSTMALYRYVPGKHELIDLMIDSALGMPPAPGGRPWGAEVTLWARSSLAIFQGRPWLLEAVMGRATIGPNWLAWLNAALQAFAESGLTAKDMVAAVLLVDGHVRSAAQVSLGPAGSAQWAEDFGRVLQTVGGDARYSAVARVAGAGGFDPLAAAEESPFEFGLQRLLNGIEAFTRARPPTSA